jgi:DNA-binding CsgD family transcriptional regulator
MTSTTAAPVQSLAAHRREKLIQPGDAFDDEARREWARVRETFREVERHLLFALAELRIALGAGEEAASGLATVRGIGIPLDAASTLDRAHGGHVNGAAPVPPCSAGLTPREVTVLRLLAQHRTDKEIAAALSISPRTVGAHVGSILRKLGVETRRGARSYALAHGLG